jgi:hypothetical protein
MIHKSWTIVGGIAIALASLQATADTIPVSYEIGDYVHPNGGYSGSWLHAADNENCTGVGQDSGDTLYMCPSSRDDLHNVRGILNGSFDSETDTLTIGEEDGGYLEVFDDEAGSWIRFDILGGSLGGEFADSGEANWFINVDELGTFAFENMQQVDGMPNQLGLDQFILWGQNREAYDCDPGECDNRWGIDLFGTRHSVPEPGTLALLGIGLLGMGAARRIRGRCS